MCFAVLVVVTVAVLVGTGLVLATHVVHASIERRLALLEGRVDHLGGEAE